MSDYIYTNNGLVSVDELKHYGVPGMKWGVKKQRQAMVTARRQKRAANREYSKAFNKATSLTGAYGKNSSRNTSNMLTAAKKANAADAKYKKAKQDYKNAKKSAKQNERAKAKADKAMSKINKQKYKDTIKQYRKEINAGESALGRAYNKLTGADKYQAEIRYDMEKRGKVNKKWRD